MKMEIPVDAPGAGTLRELLVAEGDTVTEGQVLAVLAS
jgi:acetyl-CoA carboxylase biotin carboxyl carrier protein